MPYTIESWFLEKLTRKVVDVVDCYRFDGRRGGRQVVDVVDSSNYRIRGLEATPALVYSGETT